MAIGVKGSFVSGVQLGAAESVFELIREIDRGFQYIICLLLFVSNRLILLTIIRKNEVSGALKDVSNSSDVDDVVDNNLCKAPVFCLRCPFKTIKILDLGYIQKRNGLTVSFYSGF